MVVSFDSWKYFIQISALGSLSQTLDAYLDPGSIRTDPGTVPRNAHSE